jgi:hypothetical protein
MDGATSPATGTAHDTASFDKGVDDIAALLGDPDTPDLPEETEAPAEAGPDQDIETGPDAEATAEDTAEDDGPEEIAAGGKFVSRDAKVRLDDGTVISVGDLARNNLFQRDYTRKTEELKAERESLKAKESQSGEIAQALSQQRDFLLSVAKHILPQPPDKAMLESDPIGYMQAKSAYDEQVGLLNQVYYQQQAENGRTQQETEASLNERKRVEAQKLFETMPELRDRKVYQQFWSESTELLQNEYGISPEEIEANPDHRYYKVMRDLVKLHKALKRAPKVKAEVQGKPKLLTSGARLDPKAKTSRDAQQRTEQLRKSGSMEAGIAALMDLNL